MTTLTLPMASPNSLKRTYAETGLENPTNVKNLPSVFQATVMPSSTASTHNNARSPPPSQAPQTNSLPSSPLIPNNSVPDAGTAAATAPSTVTQPPAKKAKLTFAEKEARRVEKELKDRQKAEEKAKKDEEKAKKEAKREEEKRVKEAEKEEKQRAREEEKRLKLKEQLLKDEERHRKEEEKIKKAKSQLLINSFFSQPSGANRAASRSPTRDGPSPLSSRRSSISEINAIEEKRRSRSVSTTPQKPRLPDYERSFPPFFIKIHTALAPSNRFSRGEDGLSFAQKKIDESLKGLEDGDLTEGRSRTFDAIELLHITPNDSYRCPPRVHSVKDIIAEIDGAAHNPIDLTESQFARATKKPLDLLRTIPVKYLKFAEDVRPPYMGTYTRLRDAQSMSKLARNPFSRGLPEANYEYDSEAEWEEPGEGEDLDSEGEEEEVDEDEAEMNDFLDDAEVADTRAVKRRPILGNLEPTCSGLCWEGPRPKGSGLETIDLLMFKLDILMDNPQLPIDPYTSSYWESATSKSSLQASTNPQGTLMEPPRIALKPINRQNAKLSSPSKDAKTDSSGKMKPPNGPKRFLPPELMNEFKNAVQGNDMTKIGILEILKKQFPTQPKDAIKETLEIVAERVGPNPKEKKWVLKNDF